MQNKSDLGEEVKKTSAALRRPPGSRSIGRKRKEASAASVVFSPFPTSNINSGKPSESEVSRQTDHCAFVCVILSLMNPMAQRAGTPADPPDCMLGK